MISLKWWMDLGDRIAASMGKPGSAVEVPNDITCRELYDLVYEFSRFRDGLVVIADERR